MPDCKTCKYSGPVEDINVSWSMIEWGENDTQGMYILSFAAPAPCEATDYCCDNICKRTEKGEFEDLLYEYDLEGLVTGDGQTFRELLLLRHGVRTFGALKINHKKQFHWTGIVECYDCGTRCHITPHPHYCDCGGDWRQVWKTTVEKIISKIGVRVQ